MKSRAIILLPDNGRDDDRTVAVDLDGNQTGNVRTFFLVPDPERPDEPIPDLTGVLSPDELDRLQSRPVNHGRFLYYGTVFDSTARPAAGQHSS